MLNSTKKQTPNVQVSSHTHPMAINQITKMNKNQQYLSKSYNAQQRMNHVVLSNHSLHYLKQLQAPKDIESTAQPKPGAA